MTHSITPICEFHLNRVSCPACRVGRLSVLAMMDALACNLCSHIFTVNPQRGTLTLSGSALPVYWQWDGHTWHAPGGQGLGWADKLAAGALIVCPPALIAFCSWVPLQPDSSYAWFPAFWCTLTFLCHAGCVLAILVSYYQFSLSACLRALGRYTLRWLPR